MRATSVEWRALPPLGFELDAPSHLTSLYIPMRISSRYCAKPEISSCFRLNIVILSHPAQLPANFSGPQYIATSCRQRAISCEKYGDRLRHGSGGRELVHLGSEGRV